MPGRVPLLPFAPPPTPPHPTASHPRSAITSTPGGSLDSSFPTVFHSAFFISGAGMWSAWHVNNILGVIYSSSSSSSRRGSATAGGRQILTFSIHTLRVQSARSFGIFPQYSALLSVYDFCFHMFLYGRIFNFGNFIFISCTHVCYTRYND